MSIKDELLKLRERIINIAQKDTNRPTDSVNEVIDLDDKVDEFIKWYYENMVKGYYTDIGEYLAPREMRNLIEKIAVWYELRYPAYEVNRLMPCCGLEGNNFMFKNNPYVNDLLDVNSDIKELDWDEFYNANVFIKSLPGSERCMFARPKYRELVYLSLSAHLHLTRNGIVKEATDVSFATNGVIKDEELKGLHVSKVVELLKKRGIDSYIINDLEEIIEKVNNLKHQKEEMLNCVMYRIIERGGNRIGPRRAFLFAKEFGRNIDIPFKYAVDLDDPGLRFFMNEYIKAGGSKDLECYVGYFSRASKKEKLNTIPVQDLILEENSNALSSDTQNEKELYQRLVNAIASQVDKDVLKQEKVQQLRLQRKLEKSRRKNIK